ncbi:MAG: 1-phosphofructokinase [Anaerolineae bacterium]
MIYTITLNPSIDRTLYLERLDIGEVNRAETSRIDLAGKGVNVSLALRALGLPSVIMGLAGGVTGQILVQGLTDQGLACDFVSVGGETRSNITLIEREKHVTTKLNEPGPVVSQVEVDQLLERLKALLQADDICVFCGSLPPGAPTATYAQLITAVKGWGAKAILDTSGPALALGCAAEPDWIKPNLVEAETLISGSFSEKAHWPESLAGLIASGPQCVLLSAGEEGAVFANANEAWLAVPPPVMALSTVGAGDAALAGAIYAWQNGLTREDIVHWAVATGTAAVMQEGTRMPTMDRIRSLYDAVKMRLLY